ncbi:MAG: hypothetical protein CMF23_11160 [Ignavibacteriae bacterium]|nr:hypothetical protein [Ignavibacteriota bacterium]
MTKTDIEKLYEVEPALNTEGISEKDNGEKITEEHIPEIEKCIEWFSNKKFYKIKRKGPSLEQATRYLNRDYDINVTKGIVMAALIHMKKPYFCYYNHKSYVFLVMRLKPNDLIKPGLIINLVKSYKFREDLKPKVIGYK